MSHFNWFSAISSRIDHHNIHVVSALFVLLLLVGIAVVSRRAFASPESRIVPDPRVTVPNLLEWAVEGLLNLMKGIIGPTAPTYFPIIGSLFFYIFISNLLGVIPGFIPPTDNINTNLACSLTVFLYYNVMGMRAQGVKHYLAHFMGPVLWLAPLIFVVELIGHMVRPLSLSLRLFGNITGDHVVLGIFSDLVPVLVPVIFMGLGIFVSFIQAFVFSLLSTIYIGLAVAGEEHH